MSNPITADITVLSARIGAAEKLLNDWSNAEARLNNIKADAQAASGPRRRIGEDRWAGSVRRVTVENDPRVAAQRVRDRYLESFHYDEDERPEVVDDSDNFATRNFNAELRLACAEIVKQHQRCLQRRFGDATAHTNAIAAWQFIGQRSMTITRKQAQRVFDEAVKLSQVVIDAARQRTYSRRAA